jgi:hypothetical protein
MASIETKSGIDPEAEIRHSLSAGAGVVGALAEKLMPSETIRHLRNRVISRMVKTISRYTRRLR